MKVQQFKYRKNTGIASIFTAETPEEEQVLSVLKELIEGEQGVISRQSFTFEDNTMTIDSQRYQERNGNKIGANGKPITGVGTGKGKGKKKDDK